MSQWVDCNQGSQALLQPCARKPVGSGMDVCAMPNFMSNEVVAQMIDGQMDIRYVSQPVQPPAKSTKFWVNSAPCPLHYHQYAGGIPIEF